MRISRIYQPVALAVATSITLSREASHYVVQVLRLKPQDQLIIFNGQGGEYFAVIDEAHRHRCEVRLVEFNDRQVESPCKIHLLQAISRGSRMDYAVQKAVELGVDAITPIITEYMHASLSQDRLLKRQAHWQAVAVSAAEQSGRCHVPAINTALSFAEAVKLPCDMALLFEPEGTASLGELAQVLSSVNVMIGAEGGFSAAELEMAQQARYSAYRAGPRILRTETATVVALTLVQAYCGDLKNRSPHVGNRRAYL